MFYMMDAEKLLDVDFIKQKIVVFTAYGELRKKQMKPYLPDDISELKKEFDRIEKLMMLIEENRYSFIGIRDILRKVKDLKGSLQRIEEGEVIGVTELFELKNLLYLIKKINVEQQGMDWDGLDDIYLERIQTLEELMDPNDLGVNTFYIYDEYSPKLMEIRRTKRSLERKISEMRKVKLKRVQDELNVKVRPNGELTVSKERKDLIENFEQHQELVYSSETYMNITFKIKSDEEIDGALSEIENLKKHEEDEEYVIRTYLSRVFADNLKELSWEIEKIGNLDFLLGKAYFSKGIDGVKPVISEEDEIKLVNARHLKVEETLRQNDGTFTALTLDVKKGVTCITGANMGGKSVSLKTIGMNLIIAQFGLFVPAEYMAFYPKRFIFLSMGDAQSPDMGLSTFGAEMVNLKEAINIADHGGLLLIDELARGTNPREGRAISKAIINYLKAKDSITVITTHFDGLADDEEVLHLQVTGLADVDIEEMLFELSQDEEGIKTLHKYMDYTLKEVKHIEEVPKDAINISTLMGLNEEIIENAKKFLDE